MGIHRELLSQRKLDDCLFLATPEESGHAAKERDQKDEQRAHWAEILREIPRQNESESRNRSAVSSADGREEQDGKAQ